MFDGVGLFGVGKADHQNTKDECIGLAGAGRSVDGGIRLMVLHNGI